jgi:hypothetical protein
VPVAGPVDGEHLTAGRGRGAVSGHRAAAGQWNAEFFRTPGYPVRIRVLELLGDGHLAVQDLLAEIGIEASSLSQPGAPGG